jgi:hypothetical protein
MPQKDFYQFGSTIAAKADDPHRRLHIGISILALY